MGFPGGSDGRESACSVGDPVPSLGWEDPLEKKVVTHFSILGWRSLAGYSPWSHKELDITDRLNIHICIRIKFKWDMRFTKPLTVCLLALFPLLPTFSVYAYSLHSPLWGLFPHTEFCAPLWNFFPLFPWLIFVLPRDSSFLKDTSRSPGQVRWLAICTHSVYMVKLLYQLLFYCVIVPPPQDWWGQVWLCIPDPGLAFNK